MDEIKIFDFTYRDLYQKYGADFIKEAGYFEKLCHPDFNLDLMCTPLTFLKVGIPNPAILIVTGAMAPMHYGHLQMLEVAKCAMEQAGYSVAGGYIAADHDEYIERKFEDGKFYNIFKRQQIIHQMIKNCHWLAIDPWNGVFTNCSLNFTTIIERLQRYIARHCGCHYPIFFVCGSDNARFCLSFIERGNCVVVLRPGYETQFEKYKKYANDRIIFSDRSIVEMSSTQVRSQDKPYKEQSKTLTLRIEDVEHLRVLPLLQKYGGFQDIQCTHLKDQIEQVNKLIRSKRTISLDSQILLEYNLRISRLFDFFGANTLGFTRPNGITVPPGVYDLYDDDICSGKTIEYAKKCLKLSNIDIEQTLTLTKSSSNNEILDARDFFIHRSDGGLMILHGYNSKFRIPYIYPFVCPLIRGSIQDPYQFSIDVWKMNYTFLKDNGLDKKVSECHWLEIFDYLFGPDAMLSDICLYFAENLELARKLPP